MTNPTVVFDITIPEGKCIECSYLELYRDHLTQSNVIKQSTDPFANADAVSERQLSDIAKSFEKKYGTMVTFKKSGTQKRVRIDDYLDPGDGYDTSDSFIDDSEAIDLFVAPNVSTKFGGFFVCEGAVEGMEDQNIKIDSFWGLKSHPSIPTPTHAMKKAKSKALLDRAVKRLSTPGSVKRKSKAVPTPMTIMGQENNGNNCALSTMTNLDDLFDAVLSATTPASTNSVATPSYLNKGLEVSRSPSVNGVIKTSSETNPLPSPQQQQKPTPLPANLPNEVHILVEKIVSMAQPNIDNQRRVVGKAFDGDLLNLSTVLNTGKLNHTVRAAVFAHTEDRIQWKRKSLTRRLKKLNVATEDGKMNPLLDALGDAISQVMPSILSMYTRDKETHLERMKVWQAESRLESESVDCNGTGSNPTGAPDGQAPKRPPKPGPPKKLFRWNEDCRTIFHAIVKRRLESHVALNVKSTREEFLRGLFPTLVQLWPEGWISHAALWRAALPAFHSFNNGMPSSGDGTGVSTAAAPTSTSSTVDGSSIAGRQALSGSSSAGGSSNSTAVTSQSSSSSVPSPLQQQVEQLLPPRRSLPPGTSLPATAATATTSSLTSQCKAESSGVPTTAHPVSVPMVTMAAGHQTAACNPLTASRQLPGKPEQKSVHHHRPAKPASSPLMTTGVAAAHAPWNKPTGVADGSVAVGSCSGALSKTAGDSNTLYQAVVAKATATMAVTAAASATATTGPVRAAVTSSPARQICPPIVTGSTAGGCTLSAVSMPVKVNRSTVATTTIAQRIDQTQRNATDQRHPVPTPSILQTRAPQPAPVATITTGGGPSQATGNSLAAILSTAQINQLQQQAQAFAQLGNIASAAVTRTAPVTYAASTAQVMMPPATTGQPRQMHPPPPAHQQPHYQIQGHQRHVPVPTTSRPTQHQQTLVYHQTQGQHMAPQKRQQLQAHQLQQQRHQQQQVVQQQHQNLVHMVSNAGNNCQSNANLHLAAANTLLQHIRSINPDQRQQHYQ